MRAALKPVGEDDLHALIDGRLEPARIEVVEEWLRGRPQDMARVAAWRAQRSALRERLEGKAQEPIPPRLRIGHLSGERWRLWRRRFARAAAVIIWVAIGGVGGWMLHGAVPDGDPFTAEAIAAYRTFAVEVRHPVEVDATQEAHLVQWLSRRLGHELKAPDLARFGYQLMGGRLLPADSGPAAQFMYQNAAGQRLTIYLKGGEQGGQTRFRYAEADGIAACYWVDRGFGYAVAAPVDRGTLLRVSEAVFRQTETISGR